MSRKIVYTCAKGCGQVLEAYWQFCPACGQHFGRGFSGTVAASRRRRDGKVSASPATAPRAGRGRP
jgi:hypothetical protein